MTKRFQQPHDFSGLRVPLQDRLLEDRRSIAHDLESAATRGDQPDVGIGEPLSDLRRQTGGAGLVVSNGAVLDRDLHWSRVGGRHCRRTTAVTHRRRVATMMR
jgi:hypothetical protein